MGDTGRNRNESTDGAGPDGDRGGRHARSHGHRAVAAASAAAIVLLLIGVVRLTGTLAGERDPRELVLVNTNETRTLDPQRMSRLQDLRLASALYEGLVRLDPDTGVPIPALAESWTVSEDGRTWTFRLRAGARWSSGARVVAADVAWSWMRALLPDTAARNAALFHVIDGAEAFFDRRAAAIAAFEATGDAAADTAAAEASLAAAESAFAASVGVRVIDDHTLEVRLADAIPYFADLLAYEVFSPVWRPAVEGWPAATHESWPNGTPPPMVERAFVSVDPATGRLEQDHRWARPGRHVGNGPYTLDRWRYKRDLRLVASPTWAREDRIPASESILFLTIEDGNTALLAMETGRVDWLIDVGTDAAADLLAEARAGTRTNAHATPKFGTEFFQFNCRPELAGGRFNPFADAAVRRAFVLSADRRAIIDQVTRLNEPLATAFTPPGSVPGYRTPEGIGFDPERAAREFAAAGWRDRDGDGQVEDEDGRPFPEVELLVTTSTPRSRWIALALADGWERTLGVRSRIVGKDSGFFRADLKSGAFMIARGRWYGDYGDPTTFLDLSRTGNPSNDRGFSDPAIDAALDAAAAERDPARRLAMLEDIERELFTEHAPMLVICHLVGVSMHDPERVEGLANHPRGKQDLARIRRIDANAGDAP